MRALATVPLLLALCACGADAPSEKSAPAPPVAPVPDRKEPRRPASYDGMVLIEGGRATLGPAEGYQFVAPRIEVDLASFWIDAHEVSNADFAAFVDATGYVTDAETIGNSAVFGFGRAEHPDGLWELIDGADWRHPEGPASSIDKRLDHPVVNVSQRDASAYAAWAGKRLPTDDEWEFAARGGLDEQPYPWGATLEPDGVFMGNYWQGLFPVHNTARDGYRRTAPVGTFPPNPFGLYDMGGNVWEWTASPPLGPDGASKRSVRGGSYLCREEAAEGFTSCAGYRCIARQFKPIDDGNTNVGFRCAADV